MGLIFRTFIIGLLALIQVMAPLVHAHAGFDNSPRLIHLPGLETFAENAESDDQYLQGAVIQRASPTGIIVGIAYGSHQEPPEAWADPDLPVVSDHSLLLSPLPSYRTKFPLVSALIPPQTFSIHPPPRAPPAH